MKTNFTREELNYKNGMVYKIGSGETVAIISNSKEQEANGKLLSASAFMFEKHEKNIDLCDELLNFILKGKVSDSLKKLSEIKSNCISGAWDSL